MKILTVLGTRPEFIRLSETIKKLDKFFNHILVSTDQNLDYELNKIFFEDLKIRKPNYSLHSMSDKPIKTVSKILTEIDKILEIEKPNAFLILGDTNSALSSICAKKRKIPIFHLEAGNRCYDENVPEEVNRKIIDHISDFNITYSKTAEQNLIREGINPNNIVSVGSPLTELANKYKKKFENKKILLKKKLKKNNYFVASIHREENTLNKKYVLKIENFFNHISNKYNKKIIFSTHPRLNKLLKKYKANFSKNIIFHKPFGYFDYIVLQKNSICVFSDSGSLTEETNIFGFNSINMRITNERQEGMVEAVSPMCYFNSKQADILLKIIRSNKTKSKLIDDYTSSNFSDKVIKIILSYQDLIKEKYI